MTDRQFNYLAMRGVVKAYMAKNSGKWSTKLKIVAAMALQQEVEDKILVTAGIQSTSAKGATISEKELGQIAASKTEHVCNGLKAYYDEEEDVTTFTDINFTISDFLYGRKKELIERMNKVWGKADGLDDDTLEDFEVTDAQIDELKVVIDAYNDAVPVHDTIVAATSAATEELPGLFTLLRKYMRKLDLLMGTLKAGEPTFYDGYINARGIKDLGKTQIAEEVTLIAMEYRALFGEKLKMGYWLTVRNKSNFPATLYLSDYPDVLNVEDEVIVEGNTDLKLRVPADFNNIFGHWLMVYNANKLDDVMLTIILSKEKSQSSADELVKKGK